MGLLVARAAVLCLVLAGAGVCGQKKSTPGELFSFGEDQPANSRIGSSSMYDAMLKVEKLRAQFGAVDRRALRFEVLKSEPLANFFRIDNASSALYLAEQMDRDELCQGYQQCCNDEKNCIMGLMISVAQANNEQEIFNVRIEIQDKDDNAPTFPRESYAVEIREDAAVNTRIALLAARDRDTTANGIATYSLRNKSDTFDLVVQNANNVFLRLIRPLDREAQDRYMFYLICEGRNTQKTGQIRIEVTVRDANDHHPVFLSRAYSAIVAEDHPLNEVIAKVEAIDRDDGDNGRVIYDLDLSTEYQQSLFEVDPDTGSIYLKAPLDYEKDVSHVLRVQARDGGNHPTYAETSVTINVTDVNDCAPDIQLETYENTVEVPEGNERPLPLHLTFATVRDLDRTKATNGNFTCSLNDTRFRLLSYADSSTLFKVNLTSPLDRERSRVEYVAVTCTDRGVPAQSSEKVLVVNVKDVNDNPPRFTQRSYDVYVAEGSREVMQVFTLNATDDDDSHELAYSLDAEGSRYLSVDENSGRLFTRTQVQFDRETMQRYAFIAKVVDSSGNRRYTATSTINLHVRDVNDNEPRFTQGEYVFSKAENELGFVGALRANDADSFVDSFGNKVEYSLVDSDGGRAARLFDVRPTGEVLVHSRLDREEQAQFNLTVFAVDFAEQGDTRRTATARLVVHVLDANDSPPTISWPSANNNSLRVSYRTPRGSALSRVVASDADAGLNARLTYSISHTTLKRDEFSSVGLGETLPENAIVTLDDKAMLRVARDLTESSMGQYVVTLRVSDAVHNATAKLYVTVDDSAAQRFDESVFYIDDTSGDSRQSNADAHAPSGSGPQRVSRQPAFPGGSGTNSQSNANGHNQGEQTLFHLLITLLLAVAFLVLIIICVVVIVRRARSERKVASRATKCAAAKHQQVRKRRNMDAQTHNAADYGEFQSSVDKFFAKLLCVSHRSERDVETNLSRAKTRSNRSCSSEKYNHNQDDEDEGDCDDDVCARRAHDDRRERCDASFGSDLLNHADRTYVTLDSPPISSNCAAHTLQRVDLFDGRADKYVDYAASASASAHAQATMLPPMAYCGSQLMCIPYPQCGGYATYLPNAASRKASSPCNDPVYVHKPVPMRAKSAAAADADDDADVDNRSAYFTYDEPRCAEVNNNAPRLSCSSTNDSVSNAHSSVDEPQCETEVRTVCKRSGTRTVVSCSPVRDSTATSAHSHSHSQRHFAAIVKGSYV